MTAETAAAILGSATRTGSDCQSAHQQAIEESVRGAISNAFIPQCDERGDYRPVQCHKVIINILSYAYFFCNYSKLHAYICIIIDIRN